MRFPLVLLALSHRARRLATRRIMGLLRRKLYTISFIVRYLPWMARPEKEDLYQKIVHLVIETLFQNRSVNQYVICPGDGNEFLSKSIMGCGKQRIPYTSVQRLQHRKRNAQHWARLQQTQRHSRYVSCFEKHIMINCKQWGKLSKVYLLSMAINYKQTW